MVQWGPGPDALFLVSMMKVHNVKPNYHAIAADMGDNFTNRALGHRMETLRNTAEKYVSTMALQNNAQASSAQASPTPPAKGSKRASSAAASIGKAKTTTTTTTPGKANNDKASTKTSAAKNKATKTDPLKATTKAGVKKRSAAAVGGKGKMASKIEAKGKKGDMVMEAEGDDTDATITDGEADIYEEAEEMQCA